MRLSDQTGILSAAIFIVALFVRLAPFGLYVTPDEAIWVHRSIQFLQAVASGDWTLVPQTGHPGVTTMVLGAVGVRITQLLWPATSAAHLDWIRRIAWLAPESAVAFEHLSFFLPAGRVLVAIATSMGLVVAYLAGRHRLGEHGARWLALLLALDPFFAGHAGLLHTDALQATFVLLAVVLSIPPSRLLLSRAGGSQSTSASSEWARHILRWLSVALCLALAGLTKTLGLLVAPGLALALLVWGEGGIWRRLVRVGLLAIASVVFLLVLYPTFLAAPRAALAALAGAVLYHEGIGLRPVFFAGSTHLDPGPAFYPIVLAFRLTPPVCLGFLAAIFRRKQARQLPRGLVGIAGLPALVYLVVLTLATKKFDRYILSVIPLLTILASVPLSRLRRGWRRAIMALLLLPWAAVAVVPLQYATPFLGGARGAQHVVPLGWGEASGLAAGKLNRLLPDASTASVLSSNVPGTAARFVGKTRLYADELLGCTNAIIGDPAIVPQGYELLDDLEVGGRQLASVYVSQSSPLVLPPELEMLPLVLPGPLPGVSLEAVAPTASMEDLASWLNGRFEPGSAFVWVHATDCYATTEAQLRQLFSGAQSAGSLICEPVEASGRFDVTLCEMSDEVTPDLAYLARFAGALDLVAAAWDSPVEETDKLTVKLRFNPQITLGEVDVYLALRTGTGAGEVVWAEGGQRLVSDWTWSAPQWPVGDLVDATAYILFPYSLPPGTYDLVLMLSGAEGWLGLTLGDGTFGGIELPLGQVDVMTESYSEGLLELSPVPDPGWPGMRVLGVDLPESRIAAGRTLGFAIGIERGTGATAEGLEWGLVCDQVLHQEGVLPWGPSSPETWALGERYKATYVVQLDAGLPAGPCDLVVAPATDAVHQNGGVALNRDALVVGQVQIEQRARSFELSRTPATPLLIEAGDFAELLGVDLSEDVVEPGDRLDLTLYWRALAQAEADYTVFVHLEGPEGRIWAQSDQWPAGGQAPTMTWAVGEVIVDSHALTVPPDAIPGTYTLYAGLYDVKRGTRQPLSVDGGRVDDDRVPLVALKVLR